MKQIQQLLDQGKIDIALALSVSMPGPEKTLALNLILMHCIKVGDLPESSKAAQLLGRTLNNFELKIIFRTMISKRYINFEGVKDVACQMSEPDKTLSLGQAFDKCFGQIISNHSSNNDCESKIINLVNPMSEPTKKDSFNKILEFSLSRFSYFDFAKEIVKSLGREFTQTELSKAFAEYLKEFVKRTDNYHPLFYELIMVLSMMKDSPKLKSSKENFLDLLLSECIRKKANSLILFLTDKLEDPKKTAALNIVFNSYIKTDSYLTKKEVKIALEIATEMNEPQKSVILNNFLEDYIQEGLYREAKEICKMMEREPDENELCRIVQQLIDQEKYERAQEIIPEINDQCIAADLFEKVFEGFIKLKYYGLALETLKMSGRKHEVFEKAKLLFNKMMATDKWLIESKEVAFMLSEQEKPAAHKKVEKRILIEGNGDFIVGTFRTRGLTEKEFKVFSKGYANKITDETEILKLSLVLTPSQKLDYLKNSLERLIKLKMFDAVFKVIGRMPEVEQVVAYEKLRKVFVDSGMLDWAVMIVRITAIGFTNPELETMKGKSVQEGWYEQANTIAKMAGTQLSLVELDAIMKKFLQEGRSDRASEIAAIITEQSI